jgi:arylsulfatase A
MRLANWAVVVVVAWCAVVRAAAAAPPNVVVIFCDDMGYGDIHCFGSMNPTPNLDRMAAEGTRFTNFYVGQPICTASRAALMTGCYPNRVGLLGALGPAAKIGINDRELTMAQMFKSRGYATAIFGKWHLGRAEPFLPTRHGFDEFYGLPYSHDMWPKHPSSKFPDLPLIDGEKVVATNPDPATLTTAYTEHAVDFIKRKKDTPFFLYLAHNLPHVPLGVSEKNKGKTGLGLYADVVYEIDWSVGQVMAALKENGLDEKTLVVFTSDNGPWLLYGDHAGSAGPLREGKMTTFDGGLKEPCVVRWPGHVPAGATCPQLICTMDLLPTFAAIVGAELPKDRVIDGRDIRPLLFGESGATTPHEAYYFYWGPALQAVRSGKWKLHLPHPYTHIAKPGHDGKPGEVAKPAPTIERPELFDLDADPGESTDVAMAHPDVVERLMKFVEQARDDLGDSTVSKTGKGVRPPGRVE